ncbi:MAG: PH domain-containing protein [Ruminococcus sp.]|nr:PH domain-containing protein [Ruminococcus sp.]
MKRQHPAALIGYTSKNFWLLLIPLIRGLAALRFDVMTWAKGAGWDILTVTVMIAAAVLRWYYTEYEIGDKTIRVNKGVIFRMSQEIEYSRLCAATAEENLFYQGLGLSKLYIDTDAAQSSRRNADISILVTKTERAALFNRLSEDFKGNGGGFNRNYSVSKTALILFSLLFSSALTGVVLLITLLSGGSDIIGDRLQQDFIGIVNGLSDAVATLAGKIIAGISPAGIAVSIVIGIGFLLSFTVNVMRYLKFTARRRGGGIIISCGLWVKRMYCINAKKINMADMRQNLVMKLFGITSLHVNCTGYGKRKNEIPVFVPVCSARPPKKKDGKISSGGAMGMLLPEFSLCDSYISPKPSYVWRFIWLPVFMIFGIIALGFGGLVYFPHWHELIAFLTVMGEIPAVWLLLVKAAAYCTNGINITDDSICAKYCIGYQFHTVTVPLSRVAEIRITQTLFQRFNKSCDVHIYTCSEYIGSHSVKGIPITEVQELIRERG